MSRRTERVKELLREEIADLLRSELRDPRLGGLLTVTQVDVTPDLRRAHVFISVLGTEEERTATMRALGHARAYIRRELGQRLRLRYTPEVDFLLDTSMERAQQMTDVMRQNAAERGESL